MKKRTSKLFAVAMTLVMVLSIASLITSCGAKTLEDYVNSDKDVKAQLDNTNEQFSTDEMGANIEIKENTLTYTFKYTETYNDEQLEVMKEYFEKTMESVATTFDAIRDSLAEESKIEDVVVKVRYLNGDDAEIFAAEYAKK
ncbi:major membrane immunogen (membrane-anchored lipoprotein) [Clostridiales Family XIII bacterium PM5-7]